MSKILFVTDLHSGENTSAPERYYYVPPLHSNLAIDFMRAINAYAEREKITTILNGGDLASFTPNRDQHLEKINTIMHVVSQAQADVSIAIGNHEPFWIDDLETLGFTTHGFKQTTDSDLFIFQPDIFDDNGCTIYQYPTDKMAPAIKKTLEIPQQNLVLLGHYAKDRNEEGFPKDYPVDSVYAYRDIHRGSQNNLFARMTGISPQDQSTLPLNETYNMFGCFGHEHRFRMTVQENVVSLTMPSPVQQDPNDLKKPCGLFSVLDIKDDGKISVEFKRIILNKRQPEYSSVQNVTLETMKNHYYRPSHGHQKPQILLAA